MNFRPELAAKVMAGEKTVTRRRMSTNPRSPWNCHTCSLVMDRTYAVCPGRGKPAIGRVHLTDYVRWVRLGDIDDADAVREGFAHRGKFIMAWEEINGCYDPDEKVWRVEFAVVAEPNRDGND